MAARNTSADVFIHLGDYVGLASLNTPLILTMCWIQIYESVGDGYVKVDLNSSRDIELLSRAPIGRQTLGRELATIADYRQRLAQYRTDASLSYAHQIAPWITVWSVFMWSVCVQLSPNTDLML